MGLFDRLSRLLRSNINDLIAKAENPEKMLVQVIEDMRKQLAQAKQEVAVAIADERKLRMQVEDERKQAREWERRARLAVREGRDDLAKQALVADRNTRPTPPNSRSSGPSTAKKPNASKTLSGSSIRRSRRRSARRTS